ncbi:unnamed protein product [Mycetohabitans rhizoxinica HKI 454]|uniref:Uncharacterized protein n=1 Tax=Mycetohabitans rhizoxinica (strain DSM 19002 / CIP 109453 / HKI 454) TaxID=882378 RepID=E5ARK3_MYCRK|nr:unnamed protein product [Mycetohabitans rhizoxinica HKI 454]
MQESRINMPASCNSHNTILASEPYCTNVCGLFRTD